MIAFCVGYQDGVSQAVSEGQNDTRHCSLSNIGTYQTYKNTQQPGVLLRDYIKKCISSKDNLCYALICHVIFQKLNQQMGNTGIP